MMDLFCCYRFGLTAILIVCVGFSTHLSTAQETPTAAATTDEVSALPVPLTAGAAELSPANTQVNFVGTHVGETPDPRLGGFAEFSGQLKVADDGQSLAALNLNFSVNSLWTEIGDKLTSHLKNEDFLDVENHPTAIFVSTAVSDSDKVGIVNVTGDFTLMGKTQAIVIPAEVSITPTGVVLNSKFQIDRTKFGMGKMTDKVSSAVWISLKIGQPTTAPATAAPPTEEVTPATTRAGRKNPKFDPEAKFREWDVVADGKLVGEEIPVRMRKRMEFFDTDKDAAISLEELKSKFPGYPK